MRKCSISFDFLQLFSEQLHKTPEVWPAMQTEMVSFLGNHYGVAGDDVRQELLTAGSTRDRMDVMAKHLLKVTLENLLLSVT